jgi:hypothetical protein
MTPQAVATGITGDMMRNKDPITDLKTLNTPSYFNNLSSYLMAQNKRGFLSTIPFHYITPTDTAGYYLY